MRALLSISFCFVLSFTSAQYNFNSLDSLFNISKSSISGKGGGVSVALVKGVDTFYNKSFGDFDLDNAVPIASASKWYAAVVLMTLTDEGKVSLDDKVSKYIPAFKGEKENITIRQCFALTSGLPGSSEALDEFMGDRRQTFAEMVDKIAAKPLKAMPGKELNYGGLSMQVVGRVAEIVTGKSWNTLFKEKVTEPLGMTKTRYAGALVGNVPRIAGGVISSGADALKLLEMISNRGMYKGKRILSAESVDLMLADQTGNSSIGYSPFTKYKRNMQTSKDARYGIGNWVIKDINGITINVSPGAFGFTPWVDLKNNYYGVIAVQSAFPKVMPVFWEAVRLINKQLANK